LNTDQGFPYLITVN